LEFEEDFLHFERYEADRPFALNPWTSLPTPLFFFQIPDPYFGIFFFFIASLRGSRPQGREDIRPRGSLVVRFAGQIMIHFSAHRGGSTSLTETNFCSDFSLCGPIGGLALDPD